MNTLYFDADHSDAERRKNLYAGQLYVASASPNAKKLIEHAQQMIEEAFAPHTPSTAQDHMEVEEYAAVLTDLKPAFIHHPKSKEFVAGLLTDLGADPEKTYFDVPRMRIVTTNGYLTSGVGYAHHPHRDTWYSAPRPSSTGGCRSTDRVGERRWPSIPSIGTSRSRTGREDYNYYEWNRTAAMTRASTSRPTPASSPSPRRDRSSTRRCASSPPRRRDHLLGRQSALDGPNDTGPLAVQIDFRTVNLDDVKAGAERPNLDSQCTGTTLRDYLRVTDLEHVPEEIVERYDDERPARAGWSSSPPHRRPGVHHGAGHRRQQRHRPRDRRRAGRPRCLRVGRGARPRRA